MPLASEGSWKTSARFYLASLGVLVRVSKLLPLPLLLLLPSVERDVCKCWRGQSRCSRRLFCSLWPCGPWKGFPGRQPHTKHEEPVGPVADCTPVVELPGQARRTILGHGNGRWDILGDYVSSFSRRRASTSPRTGRAWGITSRMPILRLQRCPCGDIEARLPLTTLRPHLATLRASHAQALVIALPFTGAWGPGPARVPRSSELRHRGR
jgi:hypothetical protein